MKRFIHFTGISDYEICGDISLANETNITLKFDENVTDNELKIFAINNCNVMLQGRLLTLHIKDIHYIGFVNDTFDCSIRDCNVKNVK